MSDPWQCYLVGLVTGLAVMAVPVSVLWARLKRERDRNFWAVWWARRQQQQRVER